MRDNLTNVNEDLECYCKTYKANNDNNNAFLDVRKVFEQLNKQNCCSDDGMDHNDQVVQTTVRTS